MTQNPSRPRRGRATHGTRPSHPGRCALPRRCTAHRYCCETAGRACRSARCECRCRRQGSAAIVDYLARSLDLPLPTASVLPERCGWFTPWRACRRWGQAPLGGPRAQMPARRQARIRRRHDAATSEHLCFLNYEGAWQARYAHCAASSPAASRPTVVAGMAVEGGGRGRLGFGRRQRRLWEGRGVGGYAPVRGYKMPLMTSDGHAGDMTSRMKNCAMRTPCV